MWGWMIALISGALMSVQGVFNTVLTAWKIWRALWTSSRVLLISWSMVPDS